MGLHWSRKNVLLQVIMQVNVGYHVKLYLCNEVLFAKLLIFQILCSFKAVVIQPSVSNTLIKQLNVTQILPKSKSFLH